MVRWCTVDENSVSELSLRCPMASSDEANSPCCTSLCREAGPASTDCHLALCMLFFPATATGKSRAGDRTLHMEWLASLIFKTLFAAATDPKSWRQRRRLGCVWMLSCLREEDLTTRIRDGMELISVANRNHRYRSSTGSDGFEGTCAQKVKVGYSRIRSFLILL